MVSQEDVISAQLPEAQIQLSKKMLLNYYRGLQLGVKYSLYSRATGTIFTFWGSGRAWIKYHESRFLVLVPLGLQVEIYDLSDNNTKNNEHKLWVSGFCYIYELCDYGKIT